MRIDPDPLNGLGLRPWPKPEPQAAKGIVEASIITNVILRVPCYKYTINEPRTPF